ncbi:MAG: cation transporter, partial [Chthonomonadaceae bacterium]|nr:cation transporter [Chthonomonadaceae bacterium]
VVAVKLVAAGLSHSIAVLAESLQSLLDIALSLASFWAIKVAAKPPDKSHPYGHGKAEVLLSAFQMILVIVTAGVIAWQAAMHLHDPSPISPGWGVGAMLFAIVTNTGVILFLRRQSRITSSPALAGEAEHLRGDTIASLGVIAGLVAYQATGIKQIDPIVAIAFTLVGTYFAVRQLGRLLHPLMDGSLPAEEISEIERVVSNHPETRGFHNVRTSQTGSLRVVGLHVLLDDHLTFVQAHEIAEDMESELSQALGGALVTIHYEPHEAEVAHRSAAHGENSTQPDKEP